jgi:membrane protease subunit HflC
VQWKIDDFDMFFLRTDGSKFKAKSLLEQKVVSILKAEFGRRKIQDVVSGERSELMEVIRKVANERAKKDLGLSVVDVRIKRIDFPDEVVESSIYPRMRAERERAASEIRSEGRSLAIVIRADADKKRLVLLADADKDAKLIRGDGDAKASKLYADSYGKAPEFFEFLRSLEAYKNTFSSKNDILVIKPDGEFFKYFKSGDKR